MFKLMARGIAVLGLAAIPFAPIPALAGGGGGGFGTGITITLPASADLSNRLVATVPVTVQCNPLPSDFNFGGISVSIQQAVGRYVTQGFGYGSFDSNTCDGTPHVISVPVSPFSYSGSDTLAFHGGPASASASAYACDTLYDCLGGSAGPQSIRLQ